MCTDWHFSLTCPLLSSLCGFCPQLVAKERSLSQQVKTLDSDMQTLVYENYNKFISATDTIRQMKSKVDDMEEEMGKLSEVCHPFTFSPWSLLLDNQPCRRFIWLCVLPLAVVLCSNVAE